jgi:hypothetical protein
MKLMFWRMVYRIAGPVYRCALHHARIEMERRSPHPLLDWRERGKR